MFKRALELPRKRSCLLLGPRQTGKSTLVRESLPQAHWSVDLLEQDTFLRYSKEPGLFRREAVQRIEAGAKTIFVDEVQKAPQLLDEVQLLIDRHKARFLLTGSSARKLKRGGANLLAGRAVMRRLHPLTMAELGESFDLDGVLQFGSLPAVASADRDGAVDLLSSYAGTYLREEIQAEALVRNIGGFARFLDVVASQCGDLVNFSAVGRDASLAVRSVQEYFQILEDTLLGFRLEPWKASPRARLVAHPRFYLFDTGVTNALNRRLKGSLDRSQRGKLFEQWIILECVRLIDYSASEARIFFWRTHHGAEVDLVIERHGKIRLAAEIKAKPGLAAADLAGLRAFGDAHPDVPRAAITTALHDSNLGDIAVLPYRTFFDRIGEWI